MAITHVASTGLVPAGISGGTSAAINTTGATLLVVSVGHFGTLTVSDSKGNTWLGLTARDSSGAIGRLFYCLGAMVGAGHTFTISGSGIYAAATIHAFGGVGSYHSESGTISGGTSPVASGTVTPPVDGAVIVTALSAGGGNAVATIAPAGFTITTNLGAPGVTLYQAAGYLLQSTAAAINPTWSWSDTKNSLAVVSAVFLPAGPPLAGAPVEVQSGIAATHYTTTVASLAHAYASNVTAGHTSVVLVLFKGADVDPNNIEDGAVTDSQGNAYTFRVRSNPSGAALTAIWTAPIGATGACTVTYTKPALASTHTMAVAAVEVSTSPGTTIGVEATGAAVQTTTTPTTSNLVTSGPTLMLGFVEVALFETSSAGSGWTQRATTTFANQASSLIARTADAGTYAATWTMTGAAFGYQSVAIALREIGAAPAPGVVVTIDGVAQRILHESLSIQATVNGRDRLSATLPLPTVAPEIRQEIIVTDDGVRIFGGLIDTVTTKAGSSWTDRDDQLLYDITAVDFNVLADWRYSNGPQVAETLKAYLAGGVVPFLPGVTLDPAQVDGPLLPTRTVVMQTITQVLDELSTITGYVWNVDYDRKLRMWLPSAEPAPFDVLDSNAYAVGDITVEPIATGYATSIFLLAGDGSQQELTETFIGDGTTLEWDLTHRLVTQGGTLTHAGVTENVGPGQAWELDALPTPYMYTLRRAIGSAPAVGAAIVFPYTAQYPLIYRKDDAAAVAALGGQYIEQLFTEPTVFDPAQAEALADGYLAQVTQHTVEIRYTTLRGDIEPGQTQTISIATRGLSGSWVITDVETRMRDPLLFRQVTARQPGPYAGNWRDVYKLWAQGQDRSAMAYAGGGTVTPPSGGGGGGAPDVHHTTHEPGGTDAIAALSASILSSGTLPDARLSANVALENVGNVFTAPQTLQAVTAPVLTLSETSQPADARRFRLMNYGQTLLLQALNDADTIVHGTCYMSRGGNWAVGGAVLELGRTTAMGYPLDVPFSAGNFFGGAGTWTVTTVLVNTYTLVGRLMTWACYVYGAIAGNSGFLYITLPGGVTAGRHSIGQCSTAGVLNETGAVQISVSDTKLQLARNLSATVPWPDGNHYIGFTISFLIS